MSTESYLDFVMTEPPGPTSQFVELEDQDGHGVGDVGDWVKRDDGYWVFRFPDPRKLLRRIRQLEEVEEQYHSLVSRFTTRA